MDVSDKRQFRVSRRTITIAAVISVATLVATAIAYTMLPAEIPIHWNLRGEVDNSAPRPFAFLLGTLPAFLTALLVVVPLIDPRRANYARSARSYEITMVAVVVMTAALQFLTIAVALGVDIAVDTAVKGGVGLLFIVLGNVLGTVRSTFFFGIKTPWTLSDETVWFRTHRLGGVLFVVAGMLFFVAMLFRNEMAVIIPGIGVAAAVIVPVVYSAMLYRRRAASDG